MIGDAVNIRAPFDVAFISFLISALYVRIALPYISPESMSDGNKPSRGGIAGFLAPLRILIPQRLRLANGNLKKHYGVMFLCSGIFLGVVSRESYFLGIGIDDHYSLPLVTHRC